ncbi:DUF2199 domain-containing protein (plasmid) [Streptomyces clavuligerus]|nr:DUF2199 domain-containing protein [Streptomyces clavuligerus]EDY50511.1 conserved hypothetical protein [Streptomyces clavuligerus]MBY6307839.1 DUF2199 domain-containing protein [Streptomyces clavuligerus]QCS09608.1 DUF2199 domain-containing protein [Streptomyces clavuligerus]QPJ98343.1 DUF2199 domain-containing protein [Streptomyces clavuligerus]WDN56329.1 DUF2199 domain-containing protein [Streptomyces clavuligerus]
MTSDPGFTCSCCGDHHSELPMDYTARAPAGWDPAMADASDCLLSPDQCVIRARHYFVKGLIEIPVIGSEEVFSWGVWVSLSRENFSRAVDLWDTPGRESEEPYFGWLTTDLTVYSPTTLNLKTKLHTRPVGERPFVELEPTGHPLAAEQRTGITVDRVREIAAAVLHSGDGRQR